MKLFHLNTFTENKFSGSPTPVCIDEKLPPVSLMQAIARELNQPVTAYVALSEADTFDIRYFTPSTEIPACGHATLGAAYVLLTHYGRKQIQFLTSDGTELRIGTDDSALIMEYPRFAMTDYSHDLPTLLEAMAIDQYTAVGYCQELETVFFEVANESILKKTSPDFGSLKKIKGAVKEVVVSCHSSNPEIDYLLRSFCPWIGIDEDPVTGSVHSALGPYWQKKLGKDVLTAVQASQRRGTIQIEVKTSSVLLKGKAIEVYTSTL